MVKVENVLLKSVYIAVELRVNGLMGITLGIYFIDFNFIIIGFSGFNHLIELFIV